MNRTFRFRANPPDPRERSSGHRMPGRFRKEVHTKVRTKRAPGVWGSAPRIEGHTKARAKRAPRGDLGGWPPRKKSHENSAQTRARFSATTLAFVCMVNSLLKLFIIKYVPTSSPEDCCHIGNSKNKAAYQRLPLGHS